VESIISVRAKPYLLGAAFGASALIVQTELLRAVMEAAAGGALAVSASLGAWLFWIALGASFGGRLARRVKSAEKTAFFCSLLSVPLGLALIFLAGVPRFWLDVGTGEMIPFEMLLSWSAVTCAPFAILVGISFPVLARMAVGEFSFGLESTPKSVGALWAAEAAGALFSGLCFTFLLAGNTTPVLNICLFATLPPLVAATVGIYNSRPGKVFSLLVIFCSFLIMISSYSLENHFLRLRWENSGAQGKMLDCRWTLYRNLLISKRESQTTFFDNGVPSFSFPDKYSDASLVSILLSQVSSLERILIVGPSAYGPAQAFLASGAKKVVSVHPDEEFESLLKFYLPDEMRKPLREGGYSYVKDDGRVFLTGGGRRPRSPDGERGTAGWDLVLLNLDGPAQINSSRYYTPEFFRRARRAFSQAGGVLALRLPVGANEPFPAQLDQAASIWASLKTCFTHLTVAVTQTHCHIFAADREGLLSDNLDTLIARVAPYEGRVTGLTRYLVPIFYDPTRTQPMRRILDSRSSELAGHTDTAPVAWLHHLRLWVRLARQTNPEAKTGAGPAEVLFDSVAGLTSRGLVVFPALGVSLLLMLSWVLCQRPGKQTKVISHAMVISVAAAGFTAMGATVLLIYLCQLVFGALFHQIALITAVFMASLALGSYRSADKALPNAWGCRSFSILSFGLATAAILPAGGVYILESMREISHMGAVLSQVMFYLMVAAAGYFCGALFPYAAALHYAFSDKPKTESTASALDFADHLGACLGAVAFGVIAVPALGIVSAAASLALAMVCPALFWVAVSSAGDRTRPGSR
jgi:spermidine synthase